MFVKRALQGGVVLLVLVLALAAWLLVPAHLQIRGIDPPLPGIDAVRAAVAAVPDGPVRLSWINTSSQSMPRSNVLGSGDPHPDRPYRLCHSSFVLEWDDGRTLLVDAGMTRAQAASFASVGEWTGAGPGEVSTTVARELGANGQRPDGIVFTHLHVDHVDGVRELCPPDGAELPVFATRNQLELENYTTREAAETLRDLTCLGLRRVVEGDLAPLDGFPGVFLIRAAGHTPGSQVVVAALRRGGRTAPMVFTGDVVNNLDGINYDLGKPLLYSALLVPEDDERLGRLRRLIRELRDAAGFEVLVSHDQLALEASSIPRYPGVGSQ